VQGLVFEGERRVSLAEFADPTPGPGEVVLRVAASGLCGSDLHYYRAEAAAEDVSPESVCIGGHEPAGVVEALGAGVGADQVAVGERVMVHHYSACGTCASCRSGWTQMCTAGSVMVYGKNAHGAHAPYMTVDAGSVLPLPDALSFCAGAAIGCGTGTGWGALERLGDLGGADLVVFGQGPVGLSTTMLATARGARVVAVDPSADRLGQAAKFGAAETVNPDAVDPVDAIRELTDGSGPSAVVETSGTSAAAATALDSLAPWGRFCVVGLGGIVSLDVRKFLSRQLTLMTSWSMSSVQQMACAEFIARKNLPVDDLFSHHWSLGQATEAYQEFDKQSGGKAAFVF
jgi:threonine dehydrogenase-like Zn-dependent dehydrogenase